MFTNADLMLNSVQRQASLAGVAKARPAREQSKARIRDAAWRVFRRGGMDATTVRAVAAEAGVAIGALYTYYPDKDALLSDLALASLGELGRSVQREAAGVTGRDAILRAGARAVLGLYGAGVPGAALLPVLFRAAEGAGDEEQERRVQGRLIAVLAPLAAASAKAGASAEVAGREAVALACFLFGLALFDSAGRLGRFGFDAGAVVDAYLAAGAA